MLCFRSLVGTLSRTKCRWKAQGLFLLASIFFCALQVTYASQKNLSAADARALNILEIARHVYWPNEDSIERFSIGLVGADTELLKAFRSKKRYR